MKIYISIPGSGLPAHEARENADRIKAMLSRQSHTPVSPFDIYPGKDATYEDYICACLRTMLDCESIIFCKGWEQSLSCQIEHDTAMRFKSFVGRNNNAKDFVIRYEE